MVEFIKKHKVPLIIMAAVVGLYLLYDYLSASSSSASGSDSLSPQDAADEASLEDQLSSLPVDTSGGSTSSPIATSPAISGVIPGQPTSTGTAATGAGGTTGGVTSGGITAPSSGISSGQIPGSPAGTPAAIFSGPGPTNLGVPVGTDSYSQEQAINTAANYAYGSSTANEDEALYQAIENGNASDIAAMNNYNALFTEQDPQQAALNYKAGTNPYLAMLAQGVAGSLTPAEQQLNQQAGNPAIFQYPTEETGNPSEAAGGSSAPAAPGPATSAIGLKTTTPLTPPPSGMGPAGFLAGGSTPRQLTTIPSSPAQSNGPSKSTSNPPTASPVPAKNTTNGAVSPQAPVNPARGVAPVVPTNSPIGPR
jgi:hypothetical protein